MIRMGAEESHIRMHFQRHENEYRVDLHLRRMGGKGVALGGVPLKRASELFGIASMVFFSPEDLGIVKNGPAGRRRFLDLMISDTDRLYLSDLTAYAKCLAQRNALLHEMVFRPDRIRELDIWDDQISAIGSRIIRKREEFLEEFSQYAAKEHAKLTSGKERLELVYEPCSEADQLADQIREARERDRRMKSTTTGPHRDDLAIRANGMDLRVYGSQGQLLLDDVLSELDSDRQTALLDGIADTQTLITCTGLDEFVQNRFHADRIFHVTAGKLDGGTT